ncbi:uncharacterized protein C7orf31 homolog isoform X2 [Denticeps clupeoides]|uniref:uncharacterized protein C7orf31 homolog isoform X2 n=1 Tax=Denticeps clupeoides TaxID=299321 RepID=UPI0010A2F46D|nr:uncharacterized protein C7orf31 homolog isoform X2 [Denticeps clupeoides]
MTVCSAKVQHPPAVIKGHRHFSFGGAALPENVTINQYYDLTDTKRSNLRLNDQLIPKPTDINLGGMLAGDKRPLNPLIPTNAPEVILLNKTKGCPYRHEIVKVPMETERKGMSWPGQHGFLDYPKPTNGVSQGFYPKPPKTVCPNCSLRDWGSTLSKRTANILCNLEKLQWVTSYQMHFTGNGPSNPLKLDDFDEQTIDTATQQGTPYATRLRERSHPVFVPPRPLDGRRARILQGRQSLRGQGVHNDTSYAPSDQEQGFTKWNAHRLDSLPQGSNRNLEPLRPQLEGGSPQLRCNPEQESSSAMCETCRKTHSECPALSSPVLNTGLTKPIQTFREDQAEHKALDLQNNPSTEAEKPFEFENLTGTSRATVPEGDAAKLGYMIRETNHNSLQALQDSFSKTEALRRFHQTIKSKAADLRDHHHAGRKHDFYGFNSYYFHN